MSKSRSKTLLLSYNKKIDETRFLHLSRKRYSFYFQLNQFSLKGFTGLKFCTEALLLLYTVAKKGIVKIVSIKSSQTLNSFLYPFL